MAAGVIRGPETNFWIGPRPPMRNLTCVPPTSTTRMRCGVRLSGTFLLVRIAGFSPESAALTTGGNARRWRVMLGRDAAKNERLETHDSIACRAGCCDDPGGVRRRRGRSGRQRDLESHGIDHYRCESAKR